MRSRFHTIGNDIFCKIVAGQIPCKKRFEDDFALAFDDLNPVAPVHVLVVPKLHTKSIAHVLGTKAEEAEEASLALAEPTISDAEIIGRLYAAAVKVAEDLGIDKTGYRLVVNTGEDGGQTVPHLHVHLIGGRQLTWPPG